MNLRQGFIGSAAVLMAFAATTQASYTYTFDNGSSFTAVESGFNYNPTVPNFRFDFGTSAGTTTHSAAATTVSGNGAVNLTEGFSYTNNGAGGNAYTIDLFTGGAEPTNVSNISFDIRVDPTSAVDAFGGIGFFQVATRDDGYAFNTIGTFSEELGNPTYSASTVGTYEHISIPVTGVNTTVRALTLQLYNSSDRNINGNVIFQLDNLVLTTPGSAPEPASLSLIALAVPALLRRRA